MPSGKKEDSGSNRARTEGDAISEIVSPISEIISPIPEIISPRSHLVSHPEGEAAPEITSPTPEITSPTPEIASPRSHLPSHRTVRHIPALVLRSPHTPPHCACPTSRPLCQFASSYGRSLRGWLVGTECSALAHSRARSQRPTPVADGGGPNDTSRTR